MYYLSIRKETWSNLRDQERLPWASAAWAASEGVNRNEWCEGDRGKRSEVTCFDPKDSPGELITGLTVFSEEVNSNKFLSKSQEMNFQCRNKIRTANTAHDKCIRENHTEESHLARLKVAKILINDKNIKKSCQNWP